ncbi:MAG: hypothetical protein JO168_26825 [Solirubrobacterales bacterium]|nr:hypothetical protein [Solirubrobacterales bacterium]MBV9714964.1 hypothetical protein [Solirubrobacterales bacterium]
MPNTWVIVPPDFPLEAELDDAPELALELELDEPPHAASATTEATASTAGITGL